MPGSKYLSSRCSSKSFTAHVTPLVNMLSEDSKEALHMACIFPLLMMPGIPQNIPLLYVLLRLYNRDKQAFLISNYYMKLTVNEVTLVLGLPNSGVPFKFTRSPLLDLTHKCLNKKLSEVTEEEWSPALEERRISLINLKVPACLDDIKDIQDFVKYNWPQAIHGFLHSQFDGLSKICEVRGAGENIRYLEGCSTVLLVITTFANVGDDELSLLGVEELESDFETVPEKKEKRKRGVKVDSLGYESEKEKKMKYKKQEQELLKKIRSEIKKERRGMEARLKSYIKSEVEGLKTFCESLFLKFQAGLKPTPTPSPPPHSPPSPHSPIMTSVSPTPLSQPASTLECTLVSPTQIRSQELVSRTPRKGFLRAKTVSRRTFQKGQIIEYEPDYPGQLHVADKTRKTLDSVLSKALKALQEDALHAFPEGFIDWPVVDARKSPQQSNSYDCGVFVIKYMEVVTSLEVVTWQDHQGWQADMPRFRAEIAAQICKTFARHIADKMAAC
ncbi:putative ubiquitin-like-specific protease 1B [Platanthera guangdongensis]|uniref:Ubiquitin-like-specific protease 1B n=1 Tax=Platanthera guangdongensis TaxID=2320717 RepID=A0ABR2M904_9ASPA